MQDSNNGTGGQNPGHGHNNPGGRMNMRRGVSSHPQSVQSTGPSPQNPTAAPDSTPNVDALQAAKARAAMAARARAEAEGAPFETQNTPRTRQATPAGGSQSGAAADPFAQQSPTGPAAFSPAASGDYMRAPDETVPFEAQHAGSAAQPTGRASAVGATRTTVKGGKGRAFFTRNQLKLNILIVALIVVLIAAILLAMLLPGCQQGVPGGSSTTSSSTLGNSSSVSLWEDPDYDKDANSLPVGQYAATILPEGTDAGVNYVKDTLFIGDSNTERMMQYRDITNVTLSNCIGVASMGITHVRSLKCVKFKGMDAVTIPEAVKIMQPQRIVITFGTNNVGFVSEENFIAEYEKALDAIHEAYTYADIIVASIPPVAQRRSYPNVTMSEIDKLNIALLEMADRLGYKYLNWSEAMKNPSTGYCKTGLTLDDGLHLNGEGMRAMFDYFRTHPLDTPDNRPKPLATIPVREGTPSGLFPGASSSSSSSSSSAAAYTVVFTASTGGTLEMDGQTQASFTLTMTAGQTSKAIKALPASTASSGTSYVFKNWTVKIGTGNATVIQGAGASLSGYTVPTDVVVGSVITVTAVFEAVAASSSSQAETVPQITAANIDSPPTGWTVVKQEEFSDQAVGAILGQNPAAGSAAPANKTITVRVSKGPQPAATKTITITITASAAEGGSVTPGSATITLTEGTTGSATATITATANDATYQFSGWSDGEANPSRSVTVNVPWETADGATINAGMTANFTLITTP